MAHNVSVSMKEQRRPECVVEAVPEDPSRPDGATEMYLIFDGKRIAKRWQIWNATRHDLDIARAGSCGA